MTVSLKASGLKMEDISYGLQKRTKNIKESSVLLSIHIPNA